MKRTVSILVVAILVALFVWILGYSNRALTPTQSAQKPFPGRVQYTYVGIDATGKFEMPPNVDYWQSSQKSDERGISYFEGNDGERYYNISTVAFQAMDSRFTYPELDFAILNEGKTTLTDRQLIAFEWLDAHQRKLPNGGIVWDYNFPLNYNNIVVTSAWPSAFAQAAVIHAYLAAFSVTADNRWKELAVAAALAFDVSADDGGLTTYMDGLPFFEEVPLPEGMSPHVLNGHLYSVAILGRLHKLTDNEVIKRLYRNGEQLTRKLLMKFDQGYWTRYDLRPRFAKVPLQISPGTDGPTVIKSITVKSPDGTSETMTLGNENTQTRGGWLLHGPGWGNTSDKGQGVAASGAFLEINLPVEALKSYTENSDFLIEVDHQRNATPPVFSVLGFRENLPEYYPLQMASAEQLLDGTRSTYRLPIHDLQWSTLQRYYMSWHTRLVQELAHLTADPAFFTTAVRWKNYIQTFDADKRNIDAAKPVVVANNSISAVPPIRPRPFVPSVSPALDQAVSEALQGQAAESLDQRSAALLLARYVYFRMKLGSNAHSDTEAMLASGQGSCLHASKIYADLARRIGLTARVYNIYEIPDVGGHNTVEVMIDGQWAVIDPSYGLYFTDVDGHLLPMTELTSRSFADVKVWSLKERGKLVRGLAPPAAPTEMSNVFVEVPEKKIPEFDPAASFATGKLGIQGTDLTYISDWALDLGDGEIHLGSSKHNTPESPWTGMMGLKGENGRLVSLHELGRATLHRQEQRHTLKGLNPGTEYAVQLEIAYSSAPGVVIRAEIGDQAAPAFHLAQETLSAGMIDPTAKATLSFTATAPVQTVTFSAEGGYVLLSGIRAGRKATISLADQANSTQVVVSVGAKVVAATAFYDGHGPENALDGNSLDGNYTAAREGTLPNSFTFDIGSPVRPTQLAVVWNSTREYATKLSLYGVSPDGEHTLIDVSDNTPTSEGSNTFALSTHASYSRYRFEVRDAAGQQRTLLLALSLKGEPIVTAADETQSKVQETAKLARTPTDAIVSNGATVFDSTPFYEGYGPANALDGDPLDGNYAAAREGTLPNSFTFDTSERVRVSRLAVVWNSVNEYGTDFALYGVNSDGELPLVDVSGNSPDVDGKNDFAISTQLSFSRFRFEVRAAAGQPRALILALNLHGSAVELSDSDLKEAPEDVFPAAIIVSNRGFPDVGQAIGSPPLKLSDRSHQDAARFQQIVLDVGERVRPRELVLEGPVASADWDAIQLSGLKAGESADLIAEISKNMISADGKLSVPIADDQSYRYYALRFFSEASIASLNLADVKLLSLRQRAPLSASKSNVTTQLPFDLRAQKQRTGPHAEAARTEMADTLMLVLGFLLIGWGASSIGGWGRARGYFGLTK